MPREVQNRLRYGIQPPSNSEQRKDSSDHSLGGGDDVIYTQYDLSPSHGFLHLHKASTENTAFQERTTLPELLGPERIEQGIILPLYHLFRDACLT